MKNCIKKISLQVVIIAGALYMLTGCISKPVEKEGRGRQTPTPTITGQSASGMNAEADRATPTSGAIISISVSPAPTYVEEEGMPSITIKPDTPSINPTNTPALQEVTATPKPLTAIPTPKVATPTPRPVTATPTLKPNTPTPKHATPTSTPTLTPEIVVVYEMLDMVNEARAEEGLRPYTWSAKLEQICKERMTEILYNFQTGADPHDGCRTSGEDIAITAVAERAFELWMNSDAHRSIIMSEATEDTYLDPSWEIWERVTCYNRDGVEYYAGDTIPGYPMAMACVGYDGIWVLVTEHRAGYF